MSRASRGIAVAVVLATTATATAAGQTTVAIEGTRWLLDGAVTSPGSPAEGLLMNVRMVNAVFEDRTRPDFDAEANTDAFIRQIPDYVDHGIRAFTINLQGGMPGFEGAVNSAFEPDGMLRSGYLDRVRRVIDACDQQGAVVILGCYYQRQDQILRDAEAVRAGVANVANWVEQSGFSNVVLEIANEFGHPGYEHEILKGPRGVAALIDLAHREAPGLLVSASGLGDGRLPDPVARACDFLLIHFNGTPIDGPTLADRVAALRRFGKPIVCNEDDKVGADGARMTRRCVDLGVSWGLMAKEVNQTFPFRFDGAADDPETYATIQNLTTGDTPPSPSFPPPESAGGWRKLNDPEAIRSIAGMDPDALDELADWLRASDDRKFAAVVIRRGFLVLEVERGAGMRTDLGNVKSCAKALCATVLAIASERSQAGPDPPSDDLRRPRLRLHPLGRPAERSPEGRDHRRAIA